ncbi:MAG: lipopolysaccharide transport periplasmic protein LptA [Pseudomonadales bacterium]|nr:lipopolysaccharide transport periplasmic protein LptA [Pseudomonadales bacterium]
MKTLIILLLCLPLAAPAFALESDREKPIEIQADFAEIDDTNGVATYRGNVTVAQGTLHIIADEVEIRSKEKAVTRIIASSDAPDKRLATYQQLPDGSEMVTAKAARIVYVVEKELLQLIGQASLSQPSDRAFAGDTINYDVARGVVNAESDGTKRVTSTFVPKKK